jgi:hypothetical protein
MANTRLARLGVLGFLASAAALVPVQGQHLRRDGLVPELMLIDLDGNGIRLSSVADGVSFVFAGGRPPEQTAWTLLGSRDAFVAIDQNRDGRIASSEEILGGLLGPPNGFEYLSRVLAGRGDPPPRLELGHPLFRQVVLWTDTNHDGQSQEPELQSLEYAGFVSVDLSGVGLVNEPPDAAGNVVTRRGKAMRGQPGGNAAEVITVRLAGTSSAGQ